MSKRKDDKKVNKAFKFRIYPNKTQAELINKTIGCCRFIYNKMLNDKIEYYKVNKKMLYNSPAQYKEVKEFEFLKEVDSVALANSQLNLESAFSKFFNEPKAGFPKFKSKKYCKLRYTTNFNNGKSDIVDEKLKVPKVGLLKMDIHREIPENYKYKSVTIELTRSGEYFASCLFEYEPKIKSKKLNKKKAIGLDYSSPKFYVDSNGNSPDKIKYYRESEEKLAKEQRKLSRMEKDSKNYNKQKIKIAKLSEHIANQRKDFCHKESTKLANEYDIICIEDINLQDMAQTLHLGKSTNDNGFGMFRGMLNYKLKDRGKKLIKVSKWFASSKICNHCGSKNTELTLNDRTWVCKECGAVIERDYNAAKNILQEGLKQIKT